MYNKIESLKKIRRLELNIHNTIFAKDINEVETAVKKFDFICSIRTDKDHGVTKDLPFYLISNKQDYLDIKEKLICNSKENMVFIVSNGHKFDNKLLYNIVINFNRDGTFRAEFNSRNVPLRHMYRYPEDMVNIEGDVNDTVASWSVSNKEHNKINIREVGKIVNAIYMDIESKSVFDRELEISVYKENCGELNKRYVYWEI